MIDYLYWRGDLSFKERPFNEIDNLLLSELAYVELSPFMDKEEKLTMTEVAERYYSYMKLRKLPIQPEAVVLEEMAKTERFKDTIVYNVVLKRDNTTQFSAMCLLLTDKSIYIAFRGTDDALVGWREDCEMSYKRVPAQVHAAQYLNSAIRRKKCVYRVGGHSKGGNLALYASMMLPEIKKNVIKEIYINDAPGIGPDLLERDKFDSVKDKIYKFMPDFCIVGKIFEIDVPGKIVESDAKGLYQHNPLFWQVEKDKFVALEKNTDDCKLYNDIIDRWLENATMEEREKFTQSLFEGLESTGATNLSEFINNGIKGIGNIVSSMASLDEESKGILLKMINTATNQFKETAVEGIKAIATSNKSRGKRKRAIKKSNKKINKR